MYPVYEIGQEHGLGFSLKQFLKRFEAICENHIDQGRAKAFAFIFNPRTNTSLSRLLNDRDLFVELDRLAGDTLTVFYLQNPNDQYHQAFNRTFLNKLGVEEHAEPPCIVFFRYEKGRVEDVSIVELESYHPVLGFKELYDVIQEYVENGAQTKEHRIGKMIKASGQFLTLEFFRAALKQMLSQYLR